MSADSNDGDDCDALLGSVAAVGPAAAPSTQHKVPRFTRRVVLASGILATVVVLPVALCAARGSSSSSSIATVDDSEHRSSAQALIIKAGSRDTARSLEWEVVHPGKVFVKAEKHLGSRVLGEKTRESRVMGISDDNSWLALIEEPGFIKTKLSDLSVTLLRRRPIIFARIDAGKCSDAGRFEVEDWLSCKIAAHSLEIATSSLVAPDIFNTQGCQLKDSPSQLCCTTACPPPVTTTTTTRTTTRPITTTMTTVTHTVVTKGTTTPYPTSTKPSGFPTLFCMAVIRAMSYEINIMRAAYKVTGGIYGCNGWKVYSDEKAWLGATDWSVAIPGPPPVFQKIWLNTDVFLRAWNKVFAAREFEQFEWTVKVDPDAVFVPMALQNRLSSIQFGKNPNVYVRNCEKFHSMQGPLEILSREAVKAFSRSRNVCQRGVDRTLVGEDGFLQKCLDLIGVQYHEDWNLLNDKYCEMTPRPCTNTWNAAFHPFKRLPDYFSCMKNRSLYVGPDWSHLPPAPKR